MKDLRKLVNKRKEVNKKRQRENYALARSLGFTALEAGALSQRSQKNILAYAKEVGKIVEFDTPIKTNIMDVTKEDND